MTHEDKERLKIIFNDFNYVHEYYGLPVYQNSGEYYGVRGRVGSKLKDQNVFSVKNESLLHVKRMGVCVNNKRFHIAHVDIRETPTWHTKFLSIMAILLKRLAYFELLGNMYL